MPKHDCMKFVASLSAKLATRSRHVCAFLGAGAARACGLPDVAELQQRVLAGLGSEQQEAFSRQLEGRNLEQALSRLRRIASLVGDKQSIDDLTSGQATALDNTVCQGIVRELTIKEVDLTPMLNLAAWTARTDGHFPLELFTVNYDLLLENALEKLKVPYFDGFVGNLRARFHTELVESTSGDADQAVPSFFVRLWKLHGSVNWAWEDSGQIIRLGQPVAEGLPAAIYPSDAKYDESRRVPFVVLQDRMRRALHQAETLVLISGYSFSDPHLNDSILDAVTHRQRSEFIAFCYSDIPEVLSKTALTMANLQVVCGREAILGGVRAEWKPPTDPAPNLWDADKFALCDFRNLTAHLSRSTAREPGNDGVLSELRGAAPNRGPETGGSGDA